MRTPTILFLALFHYGLIGLYLLLLLPKSLKQQKLKIVLLFIHDTFSLKFGYLAQQKRPNRYWKLFKENNWTKYPLAATPQTVGLHNKHTL
jgi:hypothetical protein